MLQCVAMCCSEKNGEIVLHVIPTSLHRKHKVHGDVCCSVLQCVAVCDSALQFVAVRCSVLQCVAVCCSVFETQRSRVRPCIKKSGYRVAKHKMP